MEVTSQNRWPSLGFDVLSIFDWLHPVHAGRLLLQEDVQAAVDVAVWEKFIRRIAGLGEIDPAHGGDGHYDKLNLFTDVAVVGGGLGGLNAALAAAEAGGERDADRRAAGAGRASAA